MKIISFFNFFFIIRMNCDNNRISNIETLLKTNPISISNNDLIYYLKCNSNNSILDPDNLNNTKEYLDKINISFSYSNIFSNTENNVFSNITWGLCSNKAIFQAPQVLQMFYTCAVVNV